ncbi:MAG: ferritin-like domain-containing protein [Flavobacteriales bacterium]|nr:ferritin-like domain-containing protein [Flavobacteriales bacterium]
MNLKTSEEWVKHFRENLKQQRVNWELKPQPEPPIPSKIIESVKAWQLAESSDGSHLIYAVTKYAMRNGDLESINAMRWFIKEEQKHGRNLGRYLDLLEVPKSNFNLFDFAFKKARRFLQSMEIWTITVLIAELHAQAYYKSLYKATSCQLLRQICLDILKDEGHHIRFQFERIIHIISNRSSSSLRLTFAAYSLYFRLINWAFWKDHKFVFEAGGLCSQEYKSKMKKSFQRIMRRIFKFQSLGNEAVNLNLSQ